MNIRNVSQQRARYRHSGLPPGLEPPERRAAPRHSLHELGLQRRDLAGESLLHRAFNNLD